MKRGDMIIIVVLGVLGFSMFFYALGGSKNEVSQVNIYIGDELIKEIAVPVSEPIIVELEEGDHHAVIHVDGSKAWFESSNCPDQICVNHGPTEHTYDIRVCLPNEFWIELEGSDSDIDAISK